MTRWAPLVAGLVIVTVSGCAGTPYRARVPGWIEGFEDARLGHRTFAVWVGYGWQVEHTRLVRYALYRAAEIATAHGFRYFSLRPDSDGTSEAALYATSAADALPPLEDLNDTSWSRRSGPRIASVRMKFRLLEAEEIGGQEGVVDAEKVLRHLAPFVGTSSPRK